MYGDLVSVIMPAYNCADWIGRSIDSIIAQTYSNWELIVVDDCSTDGTLAVLNKYLQADKRIRSYKLSQNSGAAIARNTAVDHANGVYLAFLDSDDIWKPEKLHKQIRFMSDNCYDFTCTDYGKIDENDEIKNTVIGCKKKYDYDMVLKCCPGNSTIVYNCKKLGKFHAINIRRRNDFVMWLAVIKKAGYAYGLQETLGYHRVRSGSISYKKSDLMKYQWKVYRDIEQLSIIKCCSLMIYKVLAILKLKAAARFSFGSLYRNHDQQ